jgi:hypothetical protein
VSSSNDDAHASTVPARLADLGLMGIDLHLLGDRST